MDNDNELGRLIVKFREQMNMSQKDFASKINISQSTLCRWESGSRQPAYHNIEDICKCFDISVKEFLSGEMKPYYMLKKHLMINRIIVVILLIVLIAAAIIHFSCLPCIL